jgi:hypothetical protein
MTAKVRRPAVAEESRLCDKLKYAPLSDAGPAMPASAAGPLLVIGLGCHGGIRVYGGEARLSAVQPVVG